jgi:hypothetical protein
VSITSRRKKRKSRTSQNKKKTGSDQPEDQAKVATRASHATGRRKKKRKARTSHLEEGNGESTLAGHGRTKTGKVKWQDWLAPRWHPLSSRFYFFFRTFVLSTREVSLV